MHMILQGSCFQLQWMQGLSAICPSVLEPISFEISQWLQAQLFKILYAVETVWETNGFFVE